MDLGQAFLDESRRYLTQEYAVKIRLCLAELSDEDLWWRPNEHANSIGNLVLHLAGNIRQWIVSGVGGAPDARHRQAEFDERGPLARDELLRRLDTALRDVDRVLGDLDPAVLTQDRRIQGRDTNVFRAIYHVVEHFGMHTGQIAYITKLRTGEDLGFYRDAGGLAIEEWRKRGGV
ncbi:MAG: DUF1572 domain-containing protein [Gemmatimonadota bacterium]|nr:DUF1572 domain-containing protein [Gemmatimonadota bacterium]MDH4349586.1 DUF1572 domain-containing protein [Gemmatimonadota bacterium]MDH5196120.1 DUF1572 domain-containing protein [Gemmatimonadota bacterium]